MKIVLRIFGIIAVIVAIGTGSLGMIRNFGDAKDAKELAPMVEQSRTELANMKEQVKQMSGDEADAMNEQIADTEKMLDIPSPGTFTMIGILMGALALISLISAVFLFKPGNKTATILLGAAIVAGLIAIVISPDFGGKMGAASNRTLSIVVTVPSVLVALFAFLLRNGKKPAQA